MQGGLTRRARREPLMLTRRSRRTAPAMRQSRLPSARRETSHERHPMARTARVGRAQAGPYWFDHIEVSNRLADFATQAEIDGAIAAIKDVWRALGRQMKSASSIQIEEIRYRRAGVSRAVQAMSRSNAAV